MPCSEISIWSALTASLKNQAHPQCVIRYILLKNCFPASPIRIHPLPLYFNLPFATTVTHLVCHIVATMATPFPPFPRIGSHDEKQLLDWIRSGGAVNAKGPNGLTPLCAAALRGHPTTVQLLLKNGADVNLSSQHDCTALWFGTRLEDEEKAYNITDILLKAGANVTCTSSASMLSTTPLMNALRAGLGLKVLCLLLAKQMAKDLAGAKKDADFLKNKVYVEALKDPKRVLSPPASRSLLVRAMHSLLGYLVAVVNKFTNNALFTTLGLRVDIAPAPGETTPDEKVCCCPGPSE